MLRTKHHILKPPCLINSTIGEIAGRYHYPITDKFIDDDAPRIHDDMKQFNLMDLPDEDKAYVLSRSATLTRKPWAEDDVDFDTGTQLTLFNYQAYFATSLFILRLRQFSKIPGHLYTFASSAIKYWIKRGRYVKETRNRR